MFLIRLEKQRNLLVLPLLLSILLFFISFWLSQSRNTDRSLAKKPMFVYLIARIGEIRTDWFPKTTLLIIQRDKWYKIMFLFTVSEHLFY